jgi:hypothetical protein
MWADGDSVLSKNHSFCQLFSANFARMALQQQGKASSNLSFLFSQALDRYCNMRNLGRPAGRLAGQPGHGHGHGYRIFILATHPEGI